MPPWYWRSDSAIPTCASRGTAPDVARASAALLLSHAACASKTLLVAAHTPQQFIPRSVPPALPPHPLALFNAASRSTSASTVSCALSRAIPLAPSQSCLLFAFLSFLLRDALLLLRIQVFHEDAARPPSTASTTAAANAATTGLRFTHFTARSTRPTGRAAIGSPACQRRRSSASAAALA